MDLAILDGTVMPAPRGTIPITDDGLLRGDGVFEVIRLYAGVPYALDEHLERMATSAANLRLELSPADVRADIEALLAEAGPVDAALRVLVTRGGRRIGLIEPLKALPETIALVTVAYAPTRVMDGVKSLSLPVTCAWATRSTPTARAGRSSSRRSRRSRPSTSSASATATRPATSSFTAASSSSPRRA